ncbi:MAG: shikimate kinase [Bacteriovoracia bacterium]
MKAFYLIGFRGAGKTTVGRALAKELELDFLDLDEYWEKKSGTEIIEFVAANGLDAFRREEEKLLREMETNDVPLVIATGGGVVDWPPSRALLEASPRQKIYLEVPPEELWARLENSPERKDIGDLHTFERFEALLEKRRVHYEKIATFRAENRVITDTLAILKELVKQP